MLRPIIASTVLGAVVGSVLEFELVKVIALVLLDSGALYWRCCYAVAAQVVTGSARSLQRPGVSR